VNPSVGDFAQFRAIQRASCLSNFPKSEASIPFGKPSARFGPGSRHIAPIIGTRFSGLGLRHSSATRIIK